MESVIFTDAPAGSFIAVITRPTTTVPARRGDGTPTMVPRWCTTTVIPPSSAKSGRQRSAAGSRPRGKSPPPPPPSPPPLLPPPWPPSMRPDRAEEVDEVDVLFRDVELAVTRVSRLAPVSHPATMAPSSSVASVSLVSSLSMSMSMSSPLRGGEGGGEGEEQTQPYLVEQLQGYNSYLQDTLTCNIAPQGTLESRQTQGVARQRESVRDEMTMIARIDALTDLLAQDTHDAPMAGAVSSARHEEKQQQQQQQQQHEEVSAGGGTGHGHTFSASTQRAEEELSSGWENKYEKAQRQFMAGRM